MSRDLLIRADSYLSLLWHRHTPLEIRNDFTLARDVERTIGELRKAYSASKEALESPASVRHGEEPTYIAGGGALPPWCVAGCTCWDVECAIHGQEVAPHVVASREDVESLEKAFARQTERACRMNCDAESACTCPAHQEYRAATVKSAGRSPIPGEEKAT